MSRPALRRSCRMPASQPPANGYFAQSAAATKYFRKCIAA
ncbi:hypothetical protein CFter6_4062 [Collimonas fungivorans]|uniref:Uncharacterized protein n=1 Tax=Collimonas fungivorans TaxID=158899 RepID=A0A127PGY1_9BURK|nr:hypothetical protein CFter6_4062 [Collimonas fungivorans]